MTKTAQIEKRVREAGEQGVRPRDLKDVSKNPYMLLSGLAKRGRLQRKERGRYVISGTSKQAAHVTRHPIKSHRQELWDDYSAKLRTAREAKAKLIRLVTQEN